MKNKMFCSLLLWLFIFLIHTRTQAVGTISLNSSKSSVTVGDEFNISVNLSGGSVATLTTRITIDTSKVEYVSGPTNTNFSNGRIIYTWTDPNGGETPKTNGTIATFKVRAKASGTASFSVNGNFYTPEETSLNPSFSGTSVTIKERVAVSQPTTEENKGGTTGNTTGGTSGGTTGGSSGKPTGGTSSGTTGGSSGKPTGSTGSGTTGGSSSSGTTNSGGSNNTGNTNTQNASKNANLKELHLSVEGLSPAFQKNVTRYNLIVENEVDEIEVNAIAEDSNAKVSVSGNRNLQAGVNDINIVVTARRWKNKKDVYNCCNKNGKCRFSKC